MAEKPCITQPSGSLPPFTSFTPRSNDGVGAVAAWDLPSSLPFPLTSPDFSLLTALRALSLCYDWLNQARYDTGIQRRVMGPCQECPRKTSSGRCQLCGQWQRTLVGDLSLIAVSLCDSSDFSFPPSCLPISSLLETSFPTVTHVGLKSVILLSHLPKYWNYQHAPQYHAQCLF